MKRGAVEVYFTDRTGVRWRVYEFGMHAGRTVKYDVGTVVGAYRGFVRTDDPATKRVVLIAKRADIDAARRLSVAELQRELDVSEEWPSRGVTPRSPGRPG